MMFGNNATLQQAIDAIGATPADIAGLWNVPGYPELTTSQLLQVALRPIGESIFPTTISVVKIDALPA